MMIVDDSAAVRGAIRQFVEDTTRIRVCAEVENGPEAVQKAKDSGCELVLLDIGVPHHSGVETAAALRRTLPHLKLVGFSLAVSDFDEELTTLKVFDVVLSKLDGLTKLVETLKSLALATSEP